MQSLCVNPALGKAAFSLIHNSGIVLKLIHKQTVQYAHSHQQQVGFHFPVRLRRIEAIIVLCTTVLVFIHLLIGIILLGGVGGGRTMRKYFAIKHTITVKLNKKKD